MLPPEEHLRLLKDRAAGIPTRQEGLNRSRALRGTLPGFDRAVWQEMCGTGWLGLCVPKQAGGLGRGVRALCRVTEHLGTALAPEPLVPAAMAAMLLPQAVLPDVLSGALVVLPAWQEAPGSLALTGEATLRDGRLSGRKLNVPMVAGADAFLVTTPEGLALVARDAPGLSLEVVAMPDGGHAATLDFADTPAEAWDDDAADALDAAMIATAAYLVGVMDGALEALSIAPGRDSSAVGAQFHADLRVQLSLTRAVVQAGAAAMDTEQGRGARQGAVSRAMLRATDAAVVVTQGCARLAGGLPDADTDLYRRKAMVLARAYGFASVHRDRASRAVYPG